MIKKLLLLSVFLLSITNSFCAAIYGYNSTNGYAFLLNSNPASGINITLTCSSTANNFIHYAITNSQGYYSFAGISDSYDSSASTATCTINSSKRGVTNNGPNTFTIDINEGDIGYFRGITTNFTYNNVGTATFNFDALNGYLRSLDQEFVKNQAITLNCPGNQLAINTNPNGLYDYSSTSWIYSCDPLRSDGCDILCNVSSNNQYNNFYINPQGYTGQTILVNEQKNLTYPFNAKVYGAFNPGNGTYGNITYFSYDASSYSPEIYSCKYSYNEIKNFNEMQDFNSSLGKNFYANISITGSGIRNYYVLCNTSLVTETIPRMASYNINLGESGITINSPNASILFTTNSIFNITLSQPASYCNYKVNNNPSYLMQNTTLINYYANQSGLVEGLNNVTFSCMSYYGVLSTKSVEFTADITPPEKVESFSAKLTSLGNVILTWTPVVNASRYYIYRGQSNQGAITFGLIFNVSAPMLHAEDLNINSYQVYHYKITAVDEAGNEANPAYSSGVNIVSMEDLNNEIEDLSSELTYLKDKKIMEENNLREKNEIIAELNNIKNDLIFFNKFRDLMTFSDMEIIHNINYFLTDYEDLTLDQLKSIKYQVGHDLSTYFNDYKKNLNVKNFISTINSLIINSSIIESTLEVNGKKYYHYEVTASLINPLNDTKINSIAINFPLPAQAFIDGAELINSSYNYSFNSLEPLSNHSFTYAFNSLASFNESEVNALMVEKTIPKPLTAYNVLKDSTNNLIANLVIWGLTLILSVSLLLQYKNYHATFKN